MTNYFQPLIAAVLCGAALTTCGCSSKPSRVHLPSVDSAAAGKAAMDQYDQNGDGKISGDELKNAPSLKATLPRLDGNGDSAVSADEVAARIEQWKANKIGLMPIRCTVNFGGRPLADATVTFEPEEFLGDSIKVCEGITNINGIANLSIPDSERKLPGGAPGFYKIKITSKSVQIPEKYNTQTMLGTEIATDSPTVERGVVLYIQ